MARMVLGTLLLGAGAAGGYWLRGAPAPAPAAPVVGGITVTTGARPAPGGLRPEDLRAIVREELARREPSPPPAEVAAPAPATAASAEVHDHLEAALATGTWTEADRQQLRRSLPSLSHEEREQVLHELAQAVNSGELRVAPDTRPF